MNVAHIIVSRRGIQTLAVMVFLGRVASAQELPAPPPSATRQSMQDARWTGPLLANSANTLPRGHVLVEPYVYDDIGPDNHALGSRAYVEYGLIDRLTVGLIPIVGYSSSGIQFGDVSLLAQYRLTTFREHRWVPTTAIQIQQSFPTGRYDELASRDGDALGAGSHATTLALNSQTFFWLPNGRILRMRLNVAETLQSGADVKDSSVYGTSVGFRGHVDTGRYLLVNAAWEYSMTRQWVLAVDGIYEHSGNTTVRGTQKGAVIREDSGSSWTYGFAPAVEYNMSEKVGVIFGVRLVAPGRNASFTVAPVMAINIVH